MASTSTTPGRSSNGNETSPFPSIDLVPKKETNVLEFLKQYPSYDGRNVIVGILDTGVDPGAHGIYSQADGVSPKLIDCIDCTGSGDVDVTTEVTPELTDDNLNYYTVKGLSSRMLRWPSSLPMKPFPGKDTLTVRLGVKRAYELFPAQLKSRVQSERRKLFRAEVDQWIAQVRQKLASLKKEDKEIREEYQARLDVLMDKEWQDDPGPLFDCVVYWDGTNYRALIDVQETGDLTSTPSLTSFAKERQFATFGILDQFNFCVQFYQQGTVLSIVSDASPHGTHVAGITAGADGERSGVAPGAQIVSLKIGDSRLGSMETGTSLTRALAEAIRHRCDVINLSYGEGCAIPDAGRFIELARELVWKHNIVFVSSAGNNGPAISTVGAPGGTSTACIGVSAYVSPDMMKANYSLPLKETLPEEDEEEEHLGTTYTWSSVGPAADGDFGVNVTAPGGAITSVSNWCLQKSMLMNGTSMSSPHATGCVALLISACKAEGIPVSPARIRRALENTAQLVPHLTILQQGWGMIQVDRAFEYLKLLKDSDTEDIHFDVSIENRPGEPRGIYLRQPDESSFRHTFTVRINPQFRLEDTVSEEQQKKRINFEMHFTIESGSSWVHSPKHFMLMNNGRSFRIDVDPTNLEPGVHTTRVCGIDCDSSTRRIVFSVPITVVKPLPIQRDVDLGQLEFKPAEVKRFFVVPPLGSTWMDLTVKDARDAKSDGETSAKLIVLHVLQLLPHAAYRDFAVEKFLNLRPSETEVFSIPVEEGITCEIDLARFWSVLGVTKVHVEVQFRGIRPLATEIFMTGGVGGSIVRLASDLANETISPTAVLNKWLTPIRPKADAVISPLGDRDIFPSYKREVYELVLDYEFTQEEKGSFTPRAFALQGVLYESAYESQLILAFDGEKKYLGVGDAWPSAISAGKGPVTLRLQVRHDDPAMLEKLMAFPIWIERSVDSITLSIYSTKKDMMEAGDTFKKQVLHKGHVIALYVAEPQLSKLPSAYKAGDLLLGTVQFGHTDTLLPGKGDRPNGFPVRYVIAPKPEKASTCTDTTETPEPKDERSVEERISEAIRELKVGQLGKLTSKEKEEGAFETLYEKLENEYPDYLPLRMAKLKYLDGHQDRKNLLDDVIQAAEAVVALISEDELALHFGRKSDPNDPQAVKERKDMKEKKGFLTEALARIAMAYADMDTDDAKAKFESTLRKLKDWVDIESSDKYLPLYLHRETRAERYGVALKAISKALSKEMKDRDVIRPLSKSDLYEMRANILGKLGYTILVEYETKNRAIACPKSYTLF